MTHYYSNRLPEPKLFTEHDFLILVSLAPHFKWELKDNKNKSNRYAIAPIGNGMFVEVTSCIVYKNGRQQGFNLATHNGIEDEEDDDYQYSDWVNAETLEETVLEGLKEAARSYRRYADYYNNYADLLEGKSKSSDNGD